MGWKGAPPPMPSYNDPYMGLGVLGNQSVSVGSTTGMLNHPSLISQQDIINQTYRQMVNQAPVARTATDKVTTRAMDLGIWTMHANIPQLGVYHGYQTDTHAGVFLIWDGVPHIIEDDDHAMFPSDSFMTKLRLMCRG